MIVTIDGPAGAGKSSAARGLATRLGFRFLDTGAMYRAVALIGLRKRVDWNDFDALAALANGLDLRLTDDQVYVDGQEVTEAIRTFEITSLTRYAADNLAVRERLVHLQRELAEGQDVVSEGRDQATVVFPKARCKIFLTADEHIRARRRYEDLLARGEEIDYDEVLEKQQQRDQRDRQRKVGGLAMTDDSIEVCTDGLTPEQVIDRLEEIVRACRFD